MEKIIGIVIAIILVGGLIFSYIRADYVVTQVRKNAVFTTAKITLVGKSTGGASVSSEYKYVVNGNEYLGTFSPKHICNYSDQSVTRQILGKWIGVVYNSKNISQSLPLLSVDKYRFYNFELPDSLSQNLKFYFDCD